MTTSKDSSSKLSVDAAFKSGQSARDFFKKKDRSRTTEVDDVASVRSLAWNCDGTSLFAGSEKYVTTFVFDNSSKIRFRNNCSGHEDVVDSINSARTNPNNFASCSADKTIRLWDARTGKTTSKYQTSGANLYLAYSADDNYIAYVDKSDTIGLLDLRTSQIINNQSFKEETNEIVIHPSGKFLFLAMSGGKVEILSLPHLQPIHTIRAHPTLSSCQSLCLSPDSKYLAVGASDACCSIWQLEDMVCVNTLQRLDYPVRSISYSHCGSLIATGSEDRFIDIAWAETGEKVTEISLTTECYCIAWHPRFYLLAYATAPERDMREQHRDHRGNGYGGIKVYGYPGMN